MLTNITMKAAYRGGGVEIRAIDSETQETVVIEPEQALAALTDHFTHAKTRLALKPGQKIYRYEYIND